MENWLIFAIISIFTSGFYNFSQKMAAERNYNIGLLNIYTYLVGVLFLGGYLIINFNNNIFNNLGIIFILGLLNAIFALSGKNSKIESLKNIDAVIFFPLYKTVGPILVTIISLFFFGENLTIKEIFGIIIGIMVPLLLISSSEKKLQKNLFLGLFFMFLTAILTAISSGVNKEIMINKYNIYLYMFIVAFIQVIISIGKYKYSKIKNKKYNKNGLIKFGIISGFLALLAKITFIMALEGNLAVVFTISSFSILIPIILSIIFYKDHFDFKKGLVIVLSIISIIMFI